MTNQDQFKVKVKQCFGDYFYPAGNNWALLEIIQSPFLYIWKITVVELYKLPMFNGITVGQQNRQRGWPLNPHFKNCHHIRAIIEISDPPEPLRLALRAIHAV